MKESTRIFRFAVIGTLNALITAVTIWFMMDELDINYMLSNVTAYILAQTHKFIFLIGLVEGLNCDEYLAQFLGLFVYGGVNFLMNKKVTFK